MTTTATTVDIISQGGYFFLPVFFFLSLPSCFLCSRLRIFKLWRGSAVGAVYCTWSWYPEQRVFVWVRGCVCVCVRKNVGSPQPRPGCMCECVYMCVCVWWACFLPDLHIHLASVTWGFIHSCVSNTT